MNTLITRYQDAHPGVQIKRTPIGFADFHAKIVQAAASGTFPDIAVIDTPDVPLLASQNAIGDLTWRFASWPDKDKYLEHVRDGVKYQEKFYGVPLRSNTTALIYNADHFAQANISAPPKTWAELRTAAKSLTSADHSGLCFAAAANEQLTFNFLPLMWQAGGDLRTVGDAPSVEALKFVNALVNEDKSVPRSVLQWGHSDVEKEFAAGHCSMMVNGPWTLPSVEKAGFAWAAAPLPAGAKGPASPLGGEAWVVGAKSKNTDAAWQLLTWLADPKNSAKEIGGGLGSIPNRDDTLKDPAWKWNNAVEAFAEQMPSARARSVYGPKYPQMSEAIWTMAQQVMTGERDPQQAADAAKAKIQPLLG
ncbi:ABC transporter substrate-binding protein [Lentzea tibetensis]|uniref:ABC transporter substrate-binding protein n=1 Tax=Lentzea tibetensis TaxID=2591470 RepID=UPI001647A9ED|nr:sugar ABC transporter substrate-binding protein [Lentzea tibetensis]